MKVNCAIWMFRLLAVMTTKVLVMGQPPTSGTIGGVVGTDQPAPPTPAVITLTAAPPPTSGTPEDVGTAQPPTLGGGGVVITVPTEPPPTSGNIEVSVFEDVNCDGVGDFPVPGLTMTLFDQSGTVIATALTSVDGQYSFLVPLDSAGAFDGTVVITNNPNTFVVNAGVGDPNAMAVALNSGQLVSTGNDFVLSSTDPTLCPPLALLGATIKGTVTVDLNCDGSGDQPIAGVEIQLCDENGNVLASTETESATGEYEFTDVPGDSTYIVKQVSTVGLYRDLGDADGGDPNSITVVLAGDLVSIGNYFIDTQCEPFPATIRGLVLEDLNCNDVGDVPLGDVPIQLLDENGGVVATTLTSSDGEYAFFNVPAELAYMIQQTNLPGFTDVGDFDGGDPNLITLTVAEGEITQNYNFIDKSGCDQVPSTTLGAVIGGRVSDDRDCDDKGDLPISGCVVQLCDEKGNIVATTVTSSLGEYEFEGLRAGTFVVKQVNLLGFDDVSDVDGGDPDRISVRVTRNQVSAGNDFVDTSMCDKAIPFIHFAYPGYVEPPYFQKYEDLLGQDYMKRCVKRQTPPKDGDTCRRLPKACLFGEQTCPDGSVEPTTRCNCQDGVWSCEDFQCPTIDASCPIDSPRSDPVFSVCGTDLTCAYGAQDCCGSDVPSFAQHVCECQAGAPFKCFDFQICDSSCTEVQAYVDSKENEISTKYPDLDPTCVIYDDTCDPDTSLLIFLGVEQLLSYQTGIVSVSWSPGYAVHVISETYYECGDSTYDVLVAPENFDFEAQDYTNAEFVERFRALSQTNPAYIHRETSDTTIDIEGLPGGERINVLVLQKMADFELFSFNREPSSLQVAAFSPEVNPSFTKFVLVPEDGTVTAVVNGDTVTYTTTPGTPSLPPEVNNLDPRDFTYIVTDTVDRTILAQLDEKLSGATANTVSWRFTVKGLDDIYNELDLHSSVNSDDDPNELDDDDDETDFVRRMEWDEGRRRLGLFKKIKKGLKKIKKAFKKIAKKVKKAVKALKTLVKFAFDLITTGEAELENSLSLLDVERGAHHICTSKGGGENGRLDIGARLGLSLKLNLSVTVSVLKKLSFSAQVQLVNRVGAFVFAKFAASSLQEYKPDPVRLWEGRKGNKIFAVGPVPVIVSWQPNLDFFHVEKLQLEAAASASAEVEYVVTLTFGIKNGNFYKDFKQTQEVNVPRPVLKGRLSVALEAGLTLSMNAWLYSTVRGTAALDAGARFETKMGYELDTVVLAPPWYIVEKFDGELFVRVRLEVGLDGPFIDFIKDLAVGDGSISTTTTSCKTESLNVDEGIFKDLFKPAEDPSLPQSSDPDDLFENTASFVEHSGEEASLKENLAKAKEIIQDGVIGINGAMSGTSVRDLNALVERSDTFTAADIPKGVPLDLFSKVAQVELLDKSIPIFGVPTPITLSATEVGPRCQEASINAVVLRVSGSFNEKGLFKKGVLDHKWYADLDGYLLDEDSAWVLENQSTDTLTLRLPRSELGNKERTSLADATVYLRATPELLPFLPGALYGKSKMSELWSGNVECCANSDCSSFSCVNNLCVEGIRI